MNSKYYKTWVEYMAEHPVIDEKLEKAMGTKMQGYENMMLGFILFLCM